MQKKSKIDLIRIMVNCHLNLEPFIDKNLSLAPIKLLELTEESIIKRFKHHFMQTALRLSHEKNTLIERANSSTPELEYVDYLPINAAPINNGSDLADSEHSRQIDLIYDMTAKDFLNLLTHQRADELRLENSKIEWIKKDRSTLYKISAVLASWIVDFQLANRDRPNIINFRQRERQKMLRLKNNDNDNELHICDVNLPEMNAIGIDELYLSTLIFLDNTFLNLSVINRNQSLASIKRKYFEIDKITCSLQSFIAENPDSIDWAWEYLLKKNMSESFFSLSNEIRPCRHSVEYLIFWIGSDPRNDKNYIGQIDSSIRKAWSVKKTRNRSNKVKPITLSQKSYQKLQKLAKQNNISEKQFVSNLIDRELQ